MTNVNRYRLSAALLAAILAACLLVALGLTEEALAASGDLDPSFDGDGKLTTDFGGTEGARSLVFQQDGKIVVAGDAQGGAATLYDFSLARYNQDGSLDTSFDGDGRLNTDFGSGNDHVRTVIVQQDGKIVAAGETSSSTTPTRLAVARYNPDGSPDTSFDGDGELTAGFFGYQIYDVAFQQDGKMVVAGYAYNPATAGNDFALARYNPDGSLDATFDGDGELTTDFAGSYHDFAYALVVQQDGKIVAAGEATPDAGRSRDFAMARYNLDGSPDTSFDDDGKLTTDFNGSPEVASALAVQADGKIAAVGSTYDASTNSDFAAARYNPDGSPDTSFSTDGELATDFSGSVDIATDLAVAQNGKTVVVGHAADPATGWSDFSLARYSQDGSLDTTFGGDGTITTDFGRNDRASALGLQSDGKIVAAGDALGGLGPYDFALARYSGEGTVSASCSIGEILPPVNDVGSATDEGMSAYKYGSRGVVPAKFRATCDGDPVDTQAEADAHPMTLTLTRLGATSAQDALVEGTQTGSANTGNLFRFDDAADHYVYNIGVKGLARGNYRITIGEANGGGSHDEWFSIE